MQRGAPCGTCAYHETQAALLYAAFGASLMQSPSPQGLTYRFGNFCLLPGQRLLLAADTPVKLGGRAFDMLLVLLERRDRTVGKHELMDLVWPRLVVEENNLQVQMVALRKLLGHPAIATVPGRGYRFALPVAVEGAAPVGTEPAELTAPAGTIATTTTTPTAALRSNLPDQLPALYGRDDDVALLQSLLSQHPLVTVAGAGGIGKTRLAQTAAAGLLGDYAGGVWWVDLAVLSDPALVPAAVARVLKLPASAERDTTHAVAAALKGAPALLVLDNAEHLLDSVALFVQTLRSLAPQARLLVTSQEVLRLPDEHAMRLSTLALPSGDSLDAATDSGAVALFVARARAQDPRFVLHADNRAAVIDICRRLDGIPLAIELAAARLPLLGVQGLRARLDERFNVLTAGSRAVLRRHQTLRAALDWSHGLLSAPEQVVFRRLGVCVGGFTLDWAQRIADDEDIDTWDVLDHLGALVDKSLVLAEGEGMPRYRMLETTRLFALERLGEADETERLLQRHAQAALDWLLPPPKATERLGTSADTRLLGSELDNVRAAVDWVSRCGDDGLAIDLAAHARLVFAAVGLYSEYLVRVLPIASRVTANTALPLAGRFWLSLAFAGANSAHPASADAAQRAAQVYRELGDEDTLYVALTYAIGIGSRRGNALALQALVQEAQRIEQTDWAPSALGNFQWAQHRWLLMQGRSEEALQCALKQAEHGRHRDTGFAEVVLGSNVAGCEIALGRLHDAEARARAALATLQARGIHTPMVGHVLEALSLTLALQGRHAEAIDAGRQAQGHLAQEGDDLRLLEPLALCAAGQQRFVDAARVAGHVDAAHARSGEVRWPAAAQRRAQLDAALAGALAAQDRAQLLAEGARLSRDEAFELAVGLADRHAG